MNFEAISMKMYAQLMFSTSSCFRFLYRLGIDWELTFLNKFFEINYSEFANSVEQLLASNMNTKLFCQTVQTSFLFDLLTE